MTTMSLIAVANNLDWRDNMGEFKKTQWKELYKISFLHISCWIISYLLPPSLFFPHAYHLPLSSFNSLLFLSNALHFHFLQVYLLPFFFPHVHCLSIFFLFLPSLFVVPIPLSFTLPTSLFLLFFPCILFTPFPSFFVELTPLP